MGNAAADIRKRYDNIDLLETIAMFCVISYHMTSDGITVNFDILGVGTPATYINYIIMSVLSICVPLFFFTNGFLLINKPFSLKKHLLKMARLLILGTVWAIIDSLIIMAINGEWVSVKEFVLFLWDMKIGWMNHLWFIGALICVYLFLPLIKLAADKYVRYFNYWVILCVIFILGNMFIVEALRMAGFVLTGRLIYIPDNIFHIVNPFRGVYGQAFLYFAIGSFFGLHQEKIHKWTDSRKFINTFTLTALFIVSAALLGLFGIFVCHYRNEFWDHVFGGYNTVFTAVNVLVLYELSRKYRFKGNILNRYIRTVSQCSLGIFLMHMIFIALIHMAGL